MCVLQIVGILALLILIRYLWWSSTQKSENPYMKKGEALNAMPLTSADANGDNNEETPKKEEDDSSSELEGEKPEFLETPQGDKDDLKKISGIGPKIEEKLNHLGIFHYQQIADFTDDNIKWVDENLSFKGRAMRDDWVGQAKVLAKGEETEFSKRYK